MSSEEQLIHKERLILDAARKRFAYYGFSKVTMDEIAADCGMAKASLYYYYPNKEQLFERVVTEEQRHFIDDVEGVIGQEIPASRKLCAYVERRFELFRELINLSSLGVQNFHEVKVQFSHLFRNFETRELKLLQQILLSGTGAGEFSVPNPQRTARLLLHVLQGLRLRALHDGQEPGARTYNALREEMASCVEHFLNGIRTQPSSNNGTTHHEAGREH